MLVQLEQLQKESTEEINAGLFGIRTNVTSVGSGPCLGIAEIMCSNPVETQAVFSTFF